MNQLFGDAALARLLEMHEARNAVEFAAASGSGAATLAIGGGQAAFTGVGSPLSHAVGVGMDGPVSETDLATLEAFYRDRGASVTIDLCPLAHPSLAEMLGSRGYRFGEFNNVLARRVSPEDASMAGPRVRIAGPREADLWGRTTLEGFLERAEVTPAEAALVSTLFGMKSGRPWLGFLEGAPAAAAGMAVRDRLAMFFGDSTIIRYRRQGLHTALIKSRLAYAAQHGCDLATASTLPGSGSQMNYERLGFQVLYTKMIMNG